MPAPDFFFYEIGGKHMPAPDFFFYGSYIPRNSLNKSVDRGAEIWNDGERDTSWEAIEIRGIRASALDSSRGIGMTWLRVGTTASSEGP